MTRSFKLLQLAVVVLLLAGATPAAATPGQGTLFGTDANSGNLLTVSRTTGAGSIVGNSGIALPSLAADPSTGTLYAVQGAGTPILHTLDPTTGAVTLVGNTGLGFASVGALDFAADGTLFASVNIAGDGGTGSDHLATIDTLTGQATVIGPYGTCTGITVPSLGGGSCDLEGMEAIAFDAAGVLWGAVRARGAAGTPGLYTIAPATGAATFVAPLVDAAANPASGGFVSLQFACDGTLYGGTARALGMGSDGGFLATIVPATGLFSYLGASSATGGLSLGGLAFAESCPVSILEIPTLTWWGALLLAGLLAIPGWRLSSLRS